MGNRAGKSLSLDEKAWQLIEEYRLKNDLRNTSAAVEDILKKFFTVKINDR